jgi:outer membrane protein assembly complex protein YaeT
MTPNVLPLARLLMAGLLALVAGGCGLLGETLEPQDVDLTFEGLGPLERDDVVARVAYLFEGFEQVQRRDPILDDAAFEIELLLLERGYRDARVTVRIDDPEAKKPTVRFTLASGVRTRVTRLATSGIPASDRRSVDAILHAANADTWYSTRALSAGRRSVLEWYRERGHVEAAAGEPEVQFTADGQGADVAIAFTPGPKYTLTRIDVAVDEGDWPPDVPRATVDAALTDLLGKPYSSSLLRLARGRIAGTFGERAHPDAEVAIEPRPLDPAGVVLAFRVRPGPRVRVGDVRFEGQVTTKESFLEDRVELETGAFYQRSLLRASLANLSRAGIFDRVAIDLQPAAEPANQGGVETRDVVVRVEEAAAREYRIEPGYGSYERLRIGAGVRQKNLFGTGRILDLSATVAELAQRADLSLIDPWILGPDATAVATLFWNSRQEPSFDSLEKGLQLGASWRLASEWGLRGTWTYRQSDASDVEADAPELIDDARVSELSLEPTWDTRDAFEDPHSGQLTHAGTDLSLDAFGSQLEYWRVNFEHARFLPIGARTTLAVSVRAGWIAPLGSTDEIPIQERYFNGGENTVRSFGESQLGPVDDNGTPIGGEATTVATIELRQGVARRFQIAFFVDAGTVESEHQDILRFDDPGFGVGVGLRYLLPIGPIRLDGALNPDPDPGDSDGAVHLSVGFSF